ncbi:hypothetical protein CF327_g1987 [Tilletia walkeri]|nr:hypothetical protein CF327_g1987 [Tilletia walkeri]
MTMSPPVSQGSLTLHTAPAPVSHHIGKPTSSDSSALSTSFGAAGSALSLSSSVPASTLHHNHRTQSIMPMSTIHSSSSSNQAAVNQDQEGAPHSHLGILCNLASSPPNSGSAILSQSFGSRSNGGGVKRTSSILTAEDDDEGSLLDGGKHHGKGEIHKCETCSKVYRHPSCLVKHRWEHTIHWRESSKLSASKHQTVQLLEAAAILVGMESPARSLPEEKALWPAAVSPPSSGLLGSDKVNFVKLMASKPKFEQFVHSTNQQHFATQHNNNNNNNNGISIRGGGEQHHPAASSPLSTTSELRAMSESSFGSATPTLNAGTLSPLNSLGNLVLSSPPIRAHEPRQHGSAGRTSGGGRTPAKQHPNMVGYVRTSSNGLGLASGRTAAVVTASTAGGRASKKAAKSSSFSDDEVLEAEAEAEAAEADVDSDVRVLHLDWDSLSHSQSLSDRTESGASTVVSAVSVVSGRSGSAETDRSGTLGGGSAVVGEKGEIVFKGDQEEEEEEREEEEEEEDLMEDDDEEEEGSEKDEDEDNSSRSFGDVDGMDAMEMEGVA